MFDSKKLKRLFSSFLVFTMVSLPVVSAEGLDFEASDESDVEVSSFEIVSEGDIEFESIDFELEASDEDDFEITDITIISDIDENPFLEDPVIEDIVIIDPVVEDIAIEDIVIEDVLILPVPSSGGSGGGNFGEAVAAPGPVVAPGPPAMPTGVEVVAVGGNGGVGEGDVVLTWDANTESDISHYTVWLEVDDGGSHVQADYSAVDYCTDDGCSVIIRSLINDRLHSFQVVAVDEDGEQSPASAPVSITLEDVVCEDVDPLNPTIASDPVASNGTELEDGSIELEVGDYILFTDIQNDTEDFEDGGAWVGDDVDHLDCSPLYQFDLDSLSYRCLAASPVEEIIVSMTMDHGEGSCNRFEQSNNIYVSIVEPVVDGEPGEGDPVEEEPVVESVNLVRDGEMEQELLERNWKGEFGTAVRVEEDGSQVMLLAQEEGNSYEGIQQRNIALEAGHTYRLGYDYKIAYGRVFSGIYLGSGEDAYGDFEMEYGYSSINGEWTTYLREFTVPDDWLPEHGMKLRIMADNRITDSSALAEAFIDNVYIYDIGRYSIITDGDMEAVGTGYWTESVGTADSYKISDNVGDTSLYLESEENTYGGVTQKDLFLEVDVAYTLSFDYLIDIGHILSGIYLGTGEDAWSDFEGEYGWLDSNGRRWLHYEREFTISSDSVDGWTTGDSAFLGIWIDDRAFLDNGIGASGYVNNVRLEKSNGEGPIFPVVEEPVADPVEEEPVVEEPVVAPASSSAPSGGGIVLPPVPAPSAVNLQSDDDFEGEELDGNIGLQSEDDIADPFDDIDGHWSEDYVEELRLMGVVSAKSGNSFSPESYFTRAELTKLVLDINGVEVAESVSEKPYNDVEVDAWYAPYIAKATELEIVHGHDDSTGNFGPNDYVSRAEAVKILGEASGLEITGGEMDFTDTVAGEWYEAYVAFALLKGVIDGYGDGTFGPEDKLRRGEIAKMALNMFKLTQ